MKDDYHTVLFFVLYERFVKKASSFWWPYLSLLPALEDYEGYHPMFLDEERLEGLLGSSVREKVRDDNARFVMGSAEAERGSTHDFLTRFAWRFAFSSRTRADPSQPE